MKQPESVWQSMCSEKPSFCHDFRIYIREYNETTGIHGLRYLSEKRSTTEKIVWAIIMLCSLSGCVYMISEIVSKYKDNPIVVNIATRHTPIHAVPFPAITICPEAKYSSKFFNYTDVYFKIKANQSGALSKNDYINLLCEDEDCNYGGKTVDEDFFQIIPKIAPEVEIDCFINNEYKDYTEIFTPVMIDQGICFSYNIFDRTEIFQDKVAQHSNLYQVETKFGSFDVENGYKDDAGIDVHPKRALISGAYNSFDIYLKYNSNDTDYICNSFLQGYRISVHTSWEVPHLSNHYFRVPLDKIVVVAVDPELITTSNYVKNFEPEKRNCFFKDEKPLKYFKIYTQSNCIFECLTNHTLEMCGCVEYYMPRFSSTPVCGGASINCTVSARNDLKMKDISKKITGNSLCDCKPECTALSYSFETSQSDFYWREYFKVRGFPEKHQKNGLVKGIHWSVLSIYFKAEQFMTLERNELYGTSDFIANFGGLLGLFTGFSLISLAEMVYFLSLRILCNRKMYGKWFGK